MSSDFVLKHKDLERARRILAGDRQVFKDFFEEYFDPLFRFTLNRLGDESLAKDMVQSTFCRALEKLDGYRGEAALLSWMFSICRSEMSAHFRKQRRYAEVEPNQTAEEIWAVLDTLADDRPSVEEAIMHRQMKGLIHLTLDHLPKHYGNALEWKYLEDLSVAEIAGRLGLAPKAAESLLTRARQAFRRTFDQLRRELSRPRGGAPNALSTGGSR